MLMAFAYATHITVGLYVPVLAGSRRHCIIFIMQMNVLCVAFVSAGLAASSAVNSLTNPWINATYSTNSDSPLDIKIWTGPSCKKNQSNVQKNVLLTIPKVQGICI